MGIWKPSYPARSLFLSPQPSHNTKRPLEKRETQLRERIILNSEMADLNSNFNSAVEASVLELERLGMTRVLRNEKVKAIYFYIGIRTKFARTAKTYSAYTTFHAKMLLVPKRLFFFWLVDYALEGSMF